MSSPPRDPGAALQARLDELARLVEQARTMPMSSSVMLHRGELLDLLGEARALLPQALADARAVLDERDRVLQQGRRQAAELLEQAAHERDRLVEQTDVHARASAQADRLLAEAEERVAAMQVEVDDYVDGKLATFEITLQRTLAAVERGRAKLAGRSDLDELSGEPGPHG